VSGLRADFYQVASTVVPNFAQLTAAFSRIELVPSIPFSFSVPWATDFAVRVRRNCTCTSFRWLTRFAQYTGNIELPTTGSYVFSLLSDDGSLLYIDGQLVVDNNGLHAAAEVNSAALSLAAGTHTIEIGFLQSGGLYQMTLSWTGPGIAKVQVPAAAFWYKLRDGTGEETLIAARAHACPHVDERRSDLPTSMPTAAPTTLAPTAAPTGTPVTISLSADPQSSWWIVDGVAQNPSLTLTRGSVYVFNNSAFALHPMYIKTDFSRGYTYDVFGEGAWILSTAGRSEMTSPVLQVSLATARPSCASTCPPRRQTCCTISARSIPTPCEPLTKQRALALECGLASAARRYGTLLIGSGTSAPTNGVCCSRQFSCQVWRSHAPTLPPAHGRCAVAGSDGGELHGSWRPLPRRGHRLRQPHRTLSLRGRAHDSAHCPGRDRRAARPRDGGVKVSLCRCTRTERPRQRQRSHRGPAAAGEAAPRPTAYAPVVRAWRRAPVRVLLTHSAPPRGYNGSVPGPTILARAGTPTYITWVNDLRYSNGGATRGTHWADGL
jgi:hypothetical protein